MLGNKLCDLFFVSLLKFTNEKQCFIHKQVYMSVISKFASQIIFIKYVKIINRAKKSQVGLPSFKW